MKTALITGATSGIGLEFARRLADRGYRLIVTGRRVDRLEALKLELDVPVEIISGDLSKKKECFALLDKLKDQGFKVEEYKQDKMKGYTISKSFKNIDMISTTKDSSYSLSGMLDTDKQIKDVFKVKKGLIILLILSLMRMIVI